jgi:hypothetical protein
VIFKDLKKTVVSKTAAQQQQESSLFERLQNKPFWVCLAGSSNHIKIRFLI